MKLKYKFALTIFTVGGLLLVVISGLFYYQQKNSVFEMSKVTHQLIAKEIAGDLENMLVEKANKILSISTAPVITDALKASNSEFSSLPAPQRELRISELNEEWMAKADINDPFVRQYRVNPVAAYLEHQQFIFPEEYGELFVTNRYGLTVATTGKLTTLAHAGKYWWIHTYDNGEGKIFFDDRGYDLSVGGYVLGIVVPIRREGEIIGILKANLNIQGSISKVLLNAEDSFDGNLKVARTGGLIILEKNHEPLSTRLPEKMIELIRSSDNGTITYMENGEEQLNAFASIKLASADSRYEFGGSHQSIDHDKGNTGEGWVVICGLKLDDMLASSNKTIMLILGTGFILIMMLAWVSLMLGDKLSRPIIALTDYAAAVGKGDLQTEIEVTSNDEIGLLAESFRRMVRSLDDTLVSRDILVDEIEHREKAERRLFEEKNLVQALLDNSPAMIYIKDLSGRFVLVNKHFNMIHAISGEGAIGKTSHDLYPPEIADRSVWRDAQVLKSDTPLVWEIELPTVQGPRIFLTSKFPIHDAEGNTYAVCGISTDITDRKKAEEELKEHSRLLAESDERWRSLVQNIPAFVCEIDLDGTILSINKTPPGFSSEDFVAKTVFEVAQPESRSKFEQYFPMVLETGMPQEFITMDYGAHKSEAWYEHRLTPVLKEGRVHSVILMVSEITEKKRLEAQVEHFNKMEAIGTLAGGIAHDFNNLLMGIQGNASIIHNNIDDSFSQTERLRDIEQFVRSGIKLTRQLLGFGRGGKYEIKPVDLNSILKTTTDIFERANKDIKIDVTYDESLWITEADEGQLEQVIMNLLINSMEAMPEKKKVSITTENVTLDAMDVEPFSLEPGRYIKLSVTDIGVGMDEETRKRIFEPFFTTREMGRGTGLGLASVYGIVTNHHGIIDVSSEVGKGTTFNIHLPAANDKRETLFDLPETGEEKMEVDHKAEERLLLVDDDEELLETIKMMLEMFGYEVLTATGGQEAIELYAKNSESIDMAILDFTMPEMNGAELFDKLKERNPGLKALLLSGYGLEGQVMEALERGCSGFLQKPFKMRDISKKIRTILDGGMVS